MGRYQFLFLGALFTLFATEGTVTLVGELAQGESGKPALRTDNGDVVLLKGDKDTMAVLGDERLKGTRFEVRGEFVEAGHFRVGPIYEKSMFVLRDGKRHTISYWCELCSIRTYTPGLCACCQQPTELDLQEANLE